MARDMGRIIMQTTEALDHGSALTWAMLEPVLAQHCTPSQLRACEWIFVLGVRTGSGIASVVFHSAERMAHALDADALKRARLLIARERTVAQQERALSAVPAPTRKAKRKARRAKAKK